MLIREEMAAANGNTKFDNEQDEEEGLVVEQNDDLQPNKKRVPRLIVRQVRAKSCSIFGYFIYVMARHPHSKMVSLTLTSRSRQKE